MRYKLERFIARNSAKKQLSIPVSMPLVSMTFDDMDVAAFTTGADLVSEFGACATFYVNGNLSSAYPDTPVHYTSQDLHRLHKSGHEIACHGFAHHDYQGLSAEEVENDIRLNNDFIVRHGIPAPRNFAYPFGNLNQKIKRQALNHFDSCRGVTGGINQNIADLGYLKAVPLYENRITVDEIKALLDTLSRLGGWLIFFTHAVRNTPAGFDTSPEQLRAMLAETAARHLPVLTVAEALSRFRLANQKIQS
jgi:peptidoglycan/xylan/chitin deacetylase (PgdA/CDA1 family)